MLSVSIVERPAQHVKAQGIAPVEEDGLAPLTTKPTQGKMSRKEVRHALLRFHYGALFRSSSKGASTNNFV